MNLPQITRKEIKEKGFPKPISLSEKLMDSLSWKQGSILTSLANLAKEEQNLISEINALAPTPSGILVIGGAVTVCEDEDDWRVITMRQREDLRKVRDKMKETLNQALDQGMGCLGLIQRQCPNYRVTP